MLNYYTYSERQLVLRGQLVVEISIPDSPIPEKGTTKDWHHPKAEVLEQLLSRTGIVKKPGTPKQWSYLQYAKATLHKVIFSSMLRMPVLDPSKL